MKNGNLRLRYEVYIAAASKKVWEVLTDDSATKYYFYGCSVRGTFKKGTAISYLGEGDFNMLAGEIIEVQPEQRLVNSFQARWDDKVAKDKASRVTWELAPIGQATKLTLLHDRFGEETPPYQQLASGWNVVLSSLKTYLETGGPLQLGQAS